MSGAILTHHFVQPMSGGVYGAGVGLCSWLSGSGSRDVVGPTFTNALPGPAAPENTGLDTTYRAYHRSVGIGNSVDGVALFLYQENRIWANDAPPNWSSVHTTASQNTARDSGDHTGLYPVHSRDGSRLFVVGLYRTVSNTIGYVKWDTLTDTWTSADTGVGSHTSTFGPCVQWNGYLVHAGSSGLLFFDPQDNSLLVVGYASAALRDWVHVANGRLFVLSRVSGTLNLLEFAFGGLASVGTFTGTEDGSSAGGWSVWAFTDTIFYVPYYSSSGGTGWRCEKIDVASSDLLGTVNLSDLTNPVIPDGLGADSPGDYRWPSGGAANSDQMWLSAIDCAEWPRGAFGTSGGIFSGFHLQAPGAGGTKFGTGHTNLGWNGEGARITTVSFPDPFTNMNGRYSYPVSRYGRGTKDLNGGTGPWIESVEQFSDGVVSRGLLVTFRCTSVQGALDLQLQYGSPLGTRTGPGFVAASLSTGAAVDVGGAASLNTAGPGGDSVDDVVGRGVPTQAILSHDAPSSGPGFSVGETVTGSSTASTGTVLAVNATTNRIAVTVTGGPGFTSADVITGGGSGTVAQLNANQDDNPSYQIVWDLDADGVPELSYVELSLVTIPAGTARPPGNFGGYRVGPTQVVLIPQTEEGNATQVAGPEQQALALSDNSATQVAGPEQQVLALSDNNATQVAGPEQQVTATTDNIPAAASGATNRPTTAAGGEMGVQVDGVEQGVRATLNHDDPPHPGAVLGYDTALPDGPQVWIVLDGLVELGRATFDAVNDAVGTTQALLDLAAAELDNVVVEKVVARAVDVSGVSVQPSVSVGTNTPNWDDQVASGALSLTATDQAEDLDASVPTKVARNSSSDVVTAQLDAQATATTYSVELVAYGRKIEV